MPDVSGSSSSTGSDPCALISNPTAATCPTNLCTFTPAVAAVAGSCTGTASDGTTCDLDASTDGTAECPTGCTRTDPVAAVGATCVKKSLSDVISSTEDILTTLDQLRDELSTVRTSAGSVSELQTSIDGLKAQNLQDKTTLSADLLAIIEDTEQLQTELTGTDGVNEDLDKINALIVALTVAVQNIDTIEVSRIKTCGNTSGEVGGSTNFDCSVSPDFNNNPSIRCGGNCTKEICCNLPKQMEPSPTPTEEPSNWVTYLIIVIIIGIIIGLGYMLKENTN